MKLIVMTDIGLAVALLLTPLPNLISAQEQTKQTAETTSNSEPAVDATAAIRFPPPPGLHRLAKDADLWIDVKNKMVVVDGEIALRRGQLEMFACPKGTKEHESVVAVRSKAQYVHAGLLAIGAKTGKPVQFEPKYIPASGTKIDVWVLWKDKEGKNQRVRAQDWIRNGKTGKQMVYDWVFAGSGFWKDPSDGRQFYYGDAGDFICVSNFPSATLDLPIESSQANTSLMFEAYTERIPPRGTPVRLVLQPKTSKKQLQSKEPAEKTRN